MILCNLKNSDRIESLHPLFKEAFDYVKSHDLLHTPCGRIDLRGDELFINNSNPELVPADRQVLEAHRKYIDIQILLEGEETMGWKALEECVNEKKPYSDAEDCVLYDEPGTSYVKLHAGQCAIFWPEDAHAPIIGEGKVRKLIVKVRL